MRGTERPVGSCGYAFSGKKSASARLSEKTCSVQRKGMFDDDANGGGFAVRAAGGGAAPGADDVLSVLVEAESEAFNDLRIDHMALGGDDGGHVNSALNLDLHSFVGVFGPGRVIAGRLTIAAGTGVRIAAARIVAITGAEASAIAITDAAAVAVPHRKIIRRFAERVPPIGSLDLRHLDIWIADDCGSHDNLRALDGFGRRRRKLSPREFGELAPASRGIVMLTTTTARLERARSDVRQIRRDVDRPLVRVECLRAGR